MRVSTFFASLFIAGVLSAPVYETKDVYVYYTVVVTEGRLPAPAPTPAPVSNPPAAEAARVYTWPFGHHHRFHESWFYNSPDVSTPVKEAPAKSTSTPKPQPPPPSSTPPPPPPPPPSSTPPAPKPQPTPQPQPATGNDPSPLSGGVSLLTTMNKWRAKYGVPPLAWNTQLEKNALKTGTDGGGVNQVHQLNPGTYGQVIGPGQKVAVGDLGGVSPFELSIVGWLCEVSSDSQLKSDGKDYCALVSKNLHLYYTETGHHDILTSRDYHECGCAFAKNPNAKDTEIWQGLWVCDFGFGKGN